MKTVLPLLAIHLRARREARGLSQEQAAELLAVDKDTLSRWERGMNKPRGPEIIAALRQHYGINQHELDGWFGEWILREESPEERYYVRGYEYLSAHEMDEEDLIQALVELDVALVPHMSALDEGTVAQWAPVFRESPFTWRLLTFGERIVGYWHYVCLKDSYFQLARNGELRDSGITADTIEAPSYLTPSRSFKMYVVMVGVHPAHQHLGAGSKLIASFVREVQRAAANGLFFEEVVAVAYTPQGHDLCRGFGLSPSVVHGSAATGSNRPHVYHATWRQVMRSEPFAGALKMTSAYASRFGVT